ncbi:transforming growth factor beta activator LRRC33 isoform X1 [Gadus macrocephalus]|uniref:transforming growth factor beta activator LRRC33 isoform X1 n=2 Tax=Gadus macrocephalus TaxID=80720 RepID=UPI0028CB247B|nr:transforming growth factor beta activator LRRC33 isoform X1 [Gadus macrocephalus]XP_059901379.1 transforming growth factor beta activator LRRC33 isoform X1 [Gadus macrocephalus]
MPVRTLPSSFLMLLAIWGVLVPSLSHPQPNPCRMIQRMALCNNGRLSYVPVGPPCNTEELQLNHNHIQTLLNSSLLHYSSLHTLSLAGNHLEKMEANAFGGLHRLQILNLAENELHVGYQDTSHALLQLPQLRVLDLSQNGLEDDMVFHLLQNLTSLQYLNLSRNLMQRLDESSFEGLHQLRELDLHSNMLFEIDGAFSGNPKLQRLNLAFNYLPCLVDFHMTQLVVLNASHNFIEWFVAQQELKETFHLETLDLTDNKLLFFPFLPSQSRLRNLYLSQNTVRFYGGLVDDATGENWTTSIQFYNLNGNASNVTAQLWDDSLHGDVSSVEILDLRNNQVEHLPQGFISQMQSLTRLQMQTNCLKTLNLTSEGFSGSLYELDVSNNRLSEVMAEKGTLAALGNLTYLNMSLNSLRWLPSGLFSSVESLRSVDLSYNSMGICPSETRGEDEGSPSDCVVWRNMASLRQLYLRGCGIQGMPPSLFAGMRLTHLDLSDNPGLRVETGALRALTGTLQHMGLGKTDMKSVDFSPFHSLRYLNISRNSLTQLPMSLLNLDLRMLDASENNLSTISPGDAALLAPKLRTVFLAGNPFNCCQMEWYRVFETTFTVNMVDKTEILCQDEAKITYRAGVLSILCGDSSRESVFWYLLLVLSGFLLFVGIPTVCLLTFRPLMLQKTVKKKSVKPTSY